MSQGFKYRFDEMRKNDPTKPEADAPGGSAAGDGALYAEGDRIRTLCLCWPDGRRVFLDYSYLISGEYLPEPETVVLGFTSHSVTLRGRFLDGLLQAIRQHLVKDVIMTESRYAVLEDGNRPVVTDIDVKPNGP